ncbi:MAG: hypothetical protein H0V39_06700 [Nitrosomonas sp.]|nr:hypothetical protein [Nitrosomonas sp.]
MRGKLIGSHSMPAMVIQEGLLAERINEHRLKSIKTQVLLLSTNNNPVFMGN